MFIKYRVVSDIFTGEFSRPEDACRAEQKLKSYGEDYVVYAVTYSADAEEIEATVVAAS